MKVLLIPGTGFGTESLGLFPRAIQEHGFDCQTVQLPGRHPGKSLNWWRSATTTIGTHAKQIKETIEGIIPEDMVLIGHSAGATACLLALSRLKLKTAYYVRAVILIAPSPFWGRWLPISLRDLWRWPEATWKMLTLQAVALPEALVKEKYLNDQQPTNGFLEGMRPEAGLVLIQLAGSLVPRPDINPEISLLFVAGEEDRVVPPEIVRETAEDLGGSYLSVYRGSHFFFLYNERAVQEILDWTLEKS